MSFDLKYDATVKYLKKLISRHLEISTRRQKLIFGGQLLKDEETLDKYHIQKECTIQLVTMSQNPNSLSSTPSRGFSPIKQNRYQQDIDDFTNTISPYLQFGDLILVQLIEAKELKKCDFWRQSSDPYVILAVDSFNTKSKIIKKTINPKWNEMFCFVVDSNDHNKRNLKHNDIGKRIKKKINRRIQRKMGQRPQRLDFDKNDGANAGSTDDNGDDAVMKNLRDGIGAFDFGAEEIVNHLDDQGDAGAFMASKVDYDHVLSFLVFDHDRFTPDNFMGSAEISIGKIPYDSVIDLWIPLNHIETGHLHVRIRRCLLASPMHRSIVFKLMSLERSITISDLQQNGISLDQLVGNEAWIHGSDHLSNPALEHLVSVLLMNRSEVGDDGCDGADNGHLWKSNSLKRIQSILSSQHMLPTIGNPTRYIWFSGLRSNHQDLFQLIKQYVIPKRVYYHQHKANGQANPLSFALIEFKTIRDAVFIFITFQHKKFLNSRILLGFGRRIIYDHVFLSDVKMAGFLSIYHRNKWQLCWCFLKDDYLLCHHNLQSDTAMCSIQLTQSIICYTSAKSIEILEKTGGSYFVYNHSKQEMEYWIQALQQIANTTASTSVSPAIESIDEEDEEDLMDESDREANEQDAGQSEPRDPSNIEDDDVLSTKQKQNEEEKYEDDMESAVLSVKDVILPHQLTEDDILMECGRCKNKNSLNHMISPDFVPHFCCIKCLREDILGLLDIHNIEYLSLNYSIQDFMELLYGDELSAFLDLKLCELLDSGDHFIECPACHAKWEFVPGDNDNSPDFSREIGINNKLLSEGAQTHYLAHRVCCRQCNKNFCRKCNAIPYHSGFNCNLYKVYLDADKCRFCSTALMPNDIALDPPSESLKFVCNNTICLEKRALTCRRTHPHCGHPCNGTIGEKHCMSCIEEDCEFKKAYCTQRPDDYCNICFTEELSEAPCIELDCGHIFHYQCMLQRLDLKQYMDSPSVNFACAKCPLCNMRISHNSLLKEEMKPIQALYRDVEKMAYDQLKEDGLLNTKLENGQSLMGYAMKRFAFYYCNICKKPYYGGLAQCGDLAQGLNASDFVCSPCSGIGQEKCKIHGKDYMVHKCKFCCSVATYFCWGNTHFCLDCHKRQENHDFMTTKPKKDLMQCPGPDKCPLGIEHPPNGEEFSIGCSLCRGTDFFVKTTNPPDPAHSGAAQENDNFEDEEKGNHR